MAPRKDRPWLIVSIALFVACVFAWLTQGFLSAPPEEPIKPRPTGRILGVDDEASLRERAIEEEAERRAFRPRPSGYPAATAPRHTD